MTYIRRRSRRGHLFHRVRPPVRPLRVPRVAIGPQEGFRPVPEGGRQLGRQLLRQSRFHQREAEARVQEHGARDRERVRRHPPAAGPRQAQQFI